MKTVYLIRHGLPDFPGGVRMCLGRTDLPLCEEGFRQARQAAEMLTGLPITNVFSSPLRRAVQTAQALGKPIDILEGLQELDAGAWDGLNFDEIRAKFPELYAARGKNPSLSLPGSEPLEQGLARFRNAMEQAEQRSAGDFAVYAHGGIISLFLEAVSGRAYKPGYCEILRLTAENGQFTWQEGEK